MNRRSFFRSAALAAGGVSLSGGEARAASVSSVNVAKAAADPAFKIRHGGLKQTVM
jgi:hypothetical protein